MSEVSVCALVTSIRFQSKVWCFEEKMLFSVGDGGAISRVEASQSVGATPQASVVSCPK